MFGWFGIAAMVAIGAGWGVALASAVTLSVAILRPSKTLASVTGLLYGVVLCLMAAGMLLVSMVYGPTVWNVAAGPRVIWLAAASLLLLIGLVAHPLGQSRAGKTFDLVFAWLAAAVGIWGIILLLAGQAL